MHVAETDDAIDVRREGGARHAADVLVEGENSRLRQRHDVGARVANPPHEFFGDAAAAPVRDADDYFLPDVAALGKRNRAILDAGLEWNRVVAHVGEEPRHAALDADHFESIEIDLDQPRKL